jgi:hypothetical protein
MQTNTQAFSITKGLSFSAILEYKEDGKRVFTDYTGYEFKAQFRAAKSPVADLFATVVPVAVGLGQLRISLTDAQTDLFTGTTIYYDILAKPPVGVVEKIYEGVVTLITPVSVTQWENIPPVTTPSILTGSFNTDQSLTLTVNEAGAVIYYTTDGSVPTASSTKYTTPIAITTTTTVKFFAVDTAGNVEAVHTEVYTIDKVAPVTTCNQADNAHISTTDNITLTTNETAKTYYTTDGSTPTKNSTLYAGAFQLAAGTYTIKFFSVDTAGNVEAVKTVSGIVVSQG